MFRRLALSAIVCTLLLATGSPLFALRTDGLTVVIPTIARVPGLLSTQWQTDVFIGNRFSVPKTITLTFHVAGGAPRVETIEVAAFSVVTLRDVVLATFGLENASGQLLLTTTTESVFEARARIYNVGNPAGEFGQAVPGIGLGELRRQGYLYGLSGIAGNRLNTGVANPHDRSIEVSLSVFDSANTLLSQRTIPLAPHQTVQVELFSFAGIAPREGIQIVYATDANENAFYAYASEVRNDTGDAVFVFGTSPNV
ncbi:MAG TPA: hypothetical protein VMT00_04645 [Thermoanaerobaculia bacterium]|nr:hypothetical protein [Thermoanaerobaculia bacterium]